MIKKTIAYKDYDGNDVEKDFYFNLTKAELIELEVGEKDGLAETIRDLVDESDLKQIIDMFKRIILMSVGVKSPDGRRFIKNDEIRADFMDSPAYSELFMELAANPESAGAFVRGLLPTDMQANIDKAEEVVELPQ